MHTKPSLFFVLALVFAVFPWGHACKGPVSPAVQQGLACGEKAVEDAVVSALPAVVVALGNHDSQAALAAVEALVPGLGIAVVECAVQAVVAGLASPASQPASSMAAIAAEPDAAVVRENAEAWLKTHGSP